MNLLFNFCENNNMYTRPITRVVVVVCLFFVVVIGGLLVTPFFNLMIFIAEVLGFSDRPIFKAVV